MLIIDEVLCGKITLDIEFVDRVCLNGYVKYFKNLKNAPLGAKKQLPHLGIEERGSNGLVSNGHPQFEAVEPRDAKVGRVYPIAVGSEDVIAREWVEDDPEAISLDLE